MTHAQRIDQAIARYKVASAAAVELAAAQKHLVTLARRHGVRRAGVLLLIGRSNWASLARDPAAWIARHLRKAHWRVIKTWAGDSAARRESPRAGSRGNDHRAPSTGHRARRSQ